MNTKYGVYDPETGEYTKIKFKDADPKYQELGKEEYQARRSAEKDKLNRFAYYDDDVNKVEKSVYDSRSGWDIGSGEEMAQIQVITPFDPNEIDVADSARYFGSGGNRGVNKVSRKDLENELKYNSRYFGEGYDENIENPYGLSADLLAKQAIIDANKRALSEDDSIKQGKMADNLLANWVTEIDKAIQGYVEPTDPPPLVGEIVDPPPEVVINNPPPPAGWVDPPPETITPPPSEIIETPNAEVIQIIDDGGSGTGSSNNSNVSIITDIDQDSTQTATTGNYFGPIDNVGNGNNISGGSFVIDNRQEGGDNTSINNSTQSAVVTPTVTVKQQNTTYNPYTGAAELDLFKPGSYEIDYSQILDKFKTQPFFII